MTEREQIEWFIPGDYTGTCVHHHLKDMLSVTSDKTFKKTHREILQAKMNGVNFLNTGIDKIQIREQLTKEKNKNNYMKRIIINLFIIVLAWEVLTHLPHIINLLINKIK